MKYSFCILVLLHLPGILGRHLVSNAASLDEEMAHKISLTGARGLRSGDGVDVRMFGNLRLISNRNGQSTVSDRISSTADTWSQVREESVPAGVAHSLEASLAMKDSIVTDNEDDEDYVQTVQDSDYMNLDSPGHEQGGEWQIIPKRDSFQSTPVVTQYVGTQPVQMPAIPTYIDHSASVNALQPLSSLAQEVYVTSDGEVEFGEDFGEDVGEIEHELQEDYAVESRHYL